MTWRMWDSARPKRVSVLVSRHDHCLHDLLWRWRRGELEGEIVLVISNHDDLREGRGLFGRALPPRAGGPGRKPRGRDAAARPAARAVRPGRAGALHADPLAATSSIAWASRSSTSTTRSCPPSPAPTRTAGQRARRQADRRDRALRDRGARRRADHRAGRVAGHATATTSTRWPSGVPTSSAQCLREPCGRTARTGCFATATRPWSSEARRVEDPRRPAYAGPR